MSMLGIALAQYPLDPLPDERAWRDKLERWVAKGAGTGADLLVFPEYGAMELAHLAGPDAAGDLEGSIEAVSERMAMLCDHLAALARRHAVAIVGPSGPLRRGGSVFNTAHVALPDGRAGAVRKSVPTPWERDPWGVLGDAADGPLTFEAAGIRVGVVVCYDIEFPLIGRRLAQAGVQLIVAPSCTETAHGFHRVRAGAAARALENQCFTAHCPLIGDAPWCPPVETNTGAAGVFAPMDGPFPADGVIAVGDRDVAGWVQARLDTKPLEEVRRSGGVRGLTDWDDQPGAADLPGVRSL